MPDLPDTRQPADREPSDLAALDLKRRPDAPTNKRVRQRLLAYLRPHTSRLTLGLLCGLAAGFVPAGLFFTIKAFFKTAQSGDTHALGVVCLLVVVLYSLLWGMTYGQTVLLAEVAQRIGMRMRGDIYAHLQSLSLSYFHKRRTGALMSTLTNDVPKLQGAAMMIKDVIATPLQAVVYLGMLLWASWKLTLFALIVVPLMAGAIQLLSKRLRGISKLSQAKMGDVASIMEETLSAPRIVRAFTAEAREIERFDRENREALAITMTGVRRSARLRPTIDLIGALGIALTLYVGGSMIASREWEVDDLVAYLYLVTQLSSAVGAVGNLRVSWEEMMGAADRIFTDVLDVVPEIRDAPGARALPPIEGRVEFQNVGFAYESGTPTLSGINLVIEPGQVVALVGPTGAGKSTLADLAPRFYDVTEGAVLIDGHDIRSVTVESLRRQVGIVPQETLLFSGTIRDNIAYGKPDATDAEVEAAARAANADSFIEACPLRYQTRIGERGQTLSGGERQRIAIARALLANPRLLILDEATSALDASTEALVQDALETLMQGRTTIVIAHRLSTIVSADKIVVIRAGRIAETGTHAELLARGGVYATLFETQRRAAELALPEN